MAIKLFYAPKTRSTRPRWMLEELGVPYEIVRINLGEKQHLGAEYKKVHPLGLVPAMEIDGTKLIESSAMVGYLADKFAEKGLAPSLNSKDRLPYSQWMAFAQITLESSVLAYWLNTAKLPEEKRHADLAQDALTNFRAAAEVVDKVLATNEYLVGNAFSAADILMASVLSFAKVVGLPIGDFRSLPTYLDRCKARPAFKRAIAD